MERKNDLAERQAGILMPVFSIPGPEGIGDFGETTKRFIDDTKDAGFRIWQILPLNPVGYGNSPYQPYSSFAGEELYISLDELKKDGLLEEVGVYEGPAEIVDYEKVRAFKEPYFRKAFEKFKENPEKEFQEFADRAYWLDRYALFRVLKQKNNNESWSKWSREDQEMQEVPEELKDEVEYQKFLQYEFDKQWKKILNYAHDKGLIVVGDMPIYVGHDSADVWQFKDAFLLDENYEPTAVAGCPPDYFSEDGQLWGNPLYNWKDMKGNGYEFWIKRFDWNKDLFDVIRIDHFIGFDRYWAIPAGDTTAKYGHYEDGPRYDFFDVVFDEMPDLQLIAEDLGVLRPEVAELKDKYGLLGMKISQYSFGPNEEKVGYVLPENAIAYPGTHDNDPVNGWYESLPKEERKHINKLFRQLKLKGKTAADKVVYYSLREPSRIAIIPMQDILNHSADQRINRPGTIGSPNWEWRLSDLQTYEALLPKLKKKLKNTGRLVTSR